MTKTTILTTILLAAIMVTMPITAQATVSPTSVSETVPSGGSFVVDKTVTTGPIPPNPDIYFLTDSTGSMGGAIASVQASMSNILSTVQASEPTAQFAVGEYRDIGDAFIHRTTQPMTTNAASVQTAVNNLAASGGGDNPEANLFALEQVANDPAIGFRSGTSSIVVWFGDAPGHDPRNGSTEASATAALVNAGMTVIAIDTGFLDSTGQATRISNATGGSYHSTIPANAGTIVLGAITALTTTVTPSPSCDAGLSATFDPPSHSGVAGNTSVGFEETIMVADGQAAGTYFCTIDFLDSAGASLGTQEVEVTVNNPPVCNDAVASPDTLWPPNHKMKDITISGVTDPDGDDVTITIVSIFQDEPTSGLGDGDQSPDGDGVGTSTAQVRAERSGLEDGRVYHIAFMAEDGAGGICRGLVDVGVPHDQGGTAASDNGPIYNSTLP